jgi:phage shock protein C
MNDVQPQQPQPRQRRKLYRSRTDRKVAGVCGGMAEHFDLDAMQLRALFVVLAAPAGASLLFYLLIWIIVPGAPKPSVPAGAESPAGA